MKWAARAVGDMKLEAAAPAMLAAFGKLRAASKEATMVYRDFNEAMVEMAHGGWAPELITKLEAELKRPSGDDAKKPDKIEDYKNQLFWQTSAAQILGEIGDPKAVDPLIKVLLDPAKVDVHATAVLALVKIGKPATERAIQILRDKDPKMAEFAAIRTKKATGAKQAPTDKPHVRMAAIILGTIWTFNNFNIPFWAPSATTRRRDPCAQRSSRLTTTPTRRSSPATCRACQRRRRTWRHSSRPTRASATMPA